MKQIVLKLWLLLALGLTVAVFNSCGDDSESNGNENSNGNNTENPFVETWRFTTPPSDSGYGYSCTRTYIYTFNADKTFSSTENVICEDSEGNRSPSTLGTYAYSEKTKTLTITFFGSKGEDIEMYTYAFVGNTLELTTQSGDVAVFTKQ
ncbi:MAG: DUF4923 family protein [Prevotellaceae bacterium]|jgi:hypothetical protein|nr:DUF4923 family protein [Prevotellaceae bacterium]